MQVYFMLFYVSARAFLFSLTVTFSSLVLNLALILHDFSYINIYFRISRLIFYGDIVDYWCYFFRFTKHKIF
ncbi:hypothetical protein KFK09_025868 [Dendrobium nobile]|uniref:Uncharacterized protein n=1 Tax=Dendrobium nobile TaxID=94219 RepID=A0A8T3A656_DENNO|nr:hypothetical protein KFK09_025868 [Dendrobium nobile]